VRIGRFGQLLAPGYGWCKRCKTPWRFVRYHSTSWSAAGCIALCEGCWAELTPQERLPFYRVLVESWHERPDLCRLTFDEEWALVESAVLSGG
jgi:hypothetical protein